MEELGLLKERMSSTRPVAWKNLPDISLYMDQVVSYMRRQSVIVQDEEGSITSAMINNYIKDGLVPRAQGKKYTKEPLVYLTAISLLKNVLSVRDMKLLLGEELKLGSEEKFYEEFMEILDTVFDATTQSIDVNLGEEALSHAALVFAISSCVSKLACEQILGTIRNQHSELKNDKQIKKAKIEV